MTSTATQAKEMGAGDRLRAHVATIEAAVVSVTCPSGFVYKFRKPSKFAMLFKLGRLPQSAASDAVEKWIAAGVIKAEDAAGPGFQELKVVDQILERVLELSIEPKIVVGTPANGNEVSTDMIPEEDIEYLFTWVAAGGEMSALLGTFPGKGQRGSAAGNNGKKRRAKT